QTGEEGANLRGCDLHRRAHPSEPASRKVRCVGSSGGDAVSIKTRAGTVMFRSGASLAAPRRWLYFLLWSATSKSGGREATMQLTSAQIAEFEAQGYLFLPNLFSAEEMDVLNG